MGSFIRIPEQHFIDLMNAVERVALTAERVEDDTDRLERIIPTSSEPPEIWVDLKLGHDSSDGGMPSTAVRSWDRVRQLLRPGAKITLRPGSYERLSLEGWHGHPEHKAVIRAEFPGCAFFDDLIQSSELHWRIHGTGVYRTPIPEGERGPWCGFSRNRLLPVYHDINKMHRWKGPGGLKLPKYGLVHADDVLYVRLPGKEDPREVQVYLPRRYEAPLIELKNCTNIEINRLSLVGHGDGPAIKCDSSCRNIVIKNCRTELGQRLSLPPQIGEVRGSCTAEMPGLEGLVEDILTINSAIVLTEDMRKFISRWDP